MKKLLLLLVFVSNIVIAEDPHDFTESVSPEKRWEQGFGWDERVDPFTLEVDRKHFDLVWQGDGPDIHLKRTKFPYSSTVRVRYMGVYSAHGYSNIRKSLGVGGSYTSYNSTRCREAIYSSGSIYRALLLNDNYETMYKGIRSDSGWRASNCQYILKESGDKDDRYKKLIELSMNIVGPNGDVYEKKISTGENNNATTYITITDNKERYIRYRYSYQKIKVGWDKEDGHEYTGFYYLDSISASDGRVVNLSYEKGSYGSRGPGEYFRLKSVEWNGRIINYVYDDSKTHERFRLERIEMPGGLDWVKGEKDEIKYTNGLSIKYDLDNDDSSVYMDRDLTIDYSNGLKVFYKLRHHKNIDKVEGSGRNRDVKIYLTEIKNGKYCIHKYFYNGNQIDRHSNDKSSNMTGNPYREIVFSNINCTNAIYEKKYYYDNVDPVKKGQARLKQIDEYYFYPNNKKDTFKTVFTRDDYMRPNKITETFSSNEPNTKSYSRVTNIAYEFPSNPNAGLKQIKSKTIEGLNGWGESYTYTDTAKVKTSNVNGKYDVFEYFDDDNLKFHYRRYGASNSSSSTVTYSDYKKRQPKSIAYPSITAELYDYDDFGNTTSKTLNGITSTYTYDGLDRLTQVKTADTRDHDISIQHGVNETGFTKTITKGNSTLTLQYDQINRLKEKTEVIAKPSGGTQTIKHTFKYDLLGRLTFASYPNSTLGETFEYDALNRQTKITHADGTSVTYEYKAGNQVMVTNEEGDKKRLTYQSYGDSSEKYLVEIAYQPSTKTYQSAPMVTTINRHKNGLIDNVKQNGLTQQYAYDSNWNLDYIDIPEVGKIDYTYDSRGNLKYKKVGDKAETYVLDALFRTKAVTYSNSGLNINYAYDSRGRLDNVTKGRFKWDYTYDDANNNMVKEVLTDTTSNRSFAFEYPHNAYGDIYQITYPNNETIALNPDSSGRPTQLGQYVTGITYNDNHTLNQVTFKNGLTQAFALDDRLFPERFKVGSVYDKSYDFSGSGNLMSITDNINAVNNKYMHYDQMSRLRRVDVSDGLYTQYDYDKNGNITQKFNNELMSFSFTYDSTTNRLTSKRNKDGSVQTYQYDNSANVINDGKRGFTYGPDMHLASATSEHGVDFTYHYDPYGKRTLVQREGGFDKYYLYPSIGNIAYEWSQYDNIMHLYAADQRLVTKRVCNNQDQDGDGLEACIESDFNTSDHNKDSDGDGILDFAEVHQHETDPSKQDSDGDGLSDYQEIHQIKGDPRQKDTDRDGIIDSVEVTQGTAPDGSAGSPYKPDYLAAILVPIIHNILF